MDVDVSDLIESLVRDRVLRKSSPCMEFVFSMGAIGRSRLVLGGKAESFASKDVFVELSDVCGGRIFGTSTL